MTTDPERHDGAQTPVPPALQATSAYSPNGKGDARPPTAAQQTAQGVAAIAGMLNQLPQTLAAMLSQLAGRIPAQRLCAQCLAARLPWEAAHMTEIKEAMAAAAKAAGLPEGSAADPAPFLPPHLRPGAASGMPPVNHAVTTVNGTELCTAHIPGAQGKRPLLIAQGALTSSMLAGLG